MKKKIIAFALTACMALSIAACSGSSFDEKSFEKYISDELDAEEFDYDEIQEEMDDGQEKLEDGVYFKADDDETEEFIDEIGIGEMVALPSKLDSSINYFKAEFDDDDLEDVFIASLIKVKDSKKLEDMIEDSYDLWEKNADECIDWAFTELEDNKNIILGTFDITDDLSLTIAIYTNNDTALVLYGMGPKGSKKNVQAFTEKFKLSDPIEVCSKKSSDDD